MNDQPTPPTAPVVPPPWAFATQYDQPLPTALQYSPTTSFSRMADYMQKELPTLYPDATMRICPVVATYPSANNKKSWVGQSGLTPVEAQEYHSGAVASSAAKGWPASGSVGVITSCMSNASELATGENNWHTVAVARKGREIWVHDPAYNAADHAGNVKRVDGVPGTKMVHHMLHNHWNTAEGVYFQGPPTSYSPGQMECMGRSVQWVEATIDGTLPWPPNQDASGGTWTWHNRN